MVATYVVDGMVLRNLPDLVIRCIRYSTSISFDLNRELILIQHNICIRYIILYVEADPS